MFLPSPVFALVLSAEELAQPPPSDHFIAELPAAAPLTASAQTLLDAPLAWDAWHVLVRRTTPRG